MYGLILLPEWDCGTCTAMQKEVRGCNAPPSQPLVFHGKPLDRCPRRPLLDGDSDLSEVFWLYQNYLRGILPYDASLYRHPHKLVQMFMLIDSAKAEAQAEKDQKDKKREAMKRQFNAANTR